jgi:hypothetical protein
MCHLTPRSSLTLHFVKYVMLLWRLSMHLLWRLITMSVRVLSGNKCMVCEFHCAV